MKSGKSKAGISADSAKSYAAMFAKEKLTKENLQMMDLAMQKELGITAMGEALSLNKLRSPLPRPSMLRHHLPSFQLHFEKTTQRIKISN